MNKKIAIVSCYFQQNYGSVLQALATQMALDKLGYSNETIDISGFRKEIRNAKIMYFIKAAFTSDILPAKIGMVKNVLIKKVSKKSYAINSNIRSLQFNEFCNRSFRLSASFGSIKELGLYCQDHYTDILVGSDQLWLPGNIAANYYTLNWVPRTINTIAYATSFGQSTLPKDSSAKASIFLKKIRHIGVREESGQRLVKQLTDRSVPIVCDPTLLFSGDDWLKIQRKDAIFSENYILCYFLGNNPSYREFALKLKAETGCKIVALTHLDEFIKSDDFYADYTPYDINPADFLNLIRYSSYVCTDSFHCSAFAIQYEKIFFAFRRYTRKTSSSTNSRLDTLFHLAGINGRILSGSEDIKNCLSRTINYKQVNNNLALIKKSSYEYLINSLNNAKSTDL